MAVAKWESNLNNNHILWEPTVNGNAYGTYSLLSPTARAMGWEGKNPKELLNPEVNAKYALKYLFIKLEKYEANILHTLAAYNGGSLRMDDNGVIKNINYVENVYPMYVDLNLYNRQK
jgi:soluble lytic murein transglycosylase-like protein